VDPCIIVQVHKEKSNKMQHCIKITIILYLCESQHFSGDTPPIIRSLKLHWQPLVFHTWKFVERVVGGCCQAQYVPDNIHQLHYRFWWGNLRERGHLEDPGIDGRILLRWIFRKGRSGSIQLRIWTDGRHL
jgi:hypothetical protein